MTILNEKHHLRTLLRQRRQQYHATINQRVIDFQLKERWQELNLLYPLQPEQKIAGYYPVGSELNILSLLEYLNSLGHSLCLPVITDLAELEFISWTPTAPLERDLLNIPSPSLSGGQRMDPDIILVPLLGFDQQGHRLGQGKGYYDKTLYRLIKGRKIITIGMGFGCQYLDNIVVCDKDYPMDYILTPEKIFTINKD